LKRTTLLDLLGFYRDGFINYAYLNAAVVNFSFTHNNNIVILWLHNNNYKYTHFT